MLPAASLTPVVAVVTVMSPSLLASGVTTSVYSVALTAVNAPFVPFATVTLLASNPVTASLKVKVKVTSPVAVPDTSSVIVTLGAAVSKACT